MEEFVRSDLKAIEWGVSRRSVNAWCSEGVVSGAFMDGNRWMIPVGATAPEGKRSKIREEIENGKRDRITGYYKMFSKSVAIGVQNFAKLRKNHSFYIDKTDFIAKWWTSGDDVTLITRPRRFGKTLNLSMVECFFSNECNEGEDLLERKKLFDGLKVSVWSQYNELFGSYPVLFLSFADIKSTSAAEAKEAIKLLITSIVNRQTALYFGETSTDKDRTFYDSVSGNMSDREAIEAIRKHIEMLEKRYGKRVILLLDEYDTPLIEAYQNGYWEEILPFYKQLFNALLKTNPYLERALLTGITRISKESLFSDLNNIVVVSQSSEKYENCFGFTEDEVEAALSEAGIETLFPEAKRWYDGYTFGRQRDIYNPWSIQNLLQNGKFETYWVNTSSNQLISDLLKNANAEIKETVERLLKGESFVTQIDEHIRFDLLENSEIALWSLMLATGYLKIVSSQTDEHYNRHYELALTNLEVQIMLRNMVQNWFKESSRDYNGFLQALFTFDDEFMTHYLNEIALKSFSYNDAGSIEESERFYHGFTLGLMVDLAEDYIVKSNRESGLGRFDVMLIPRKPEKPAFVIEFKVVRRNMSMEETVEAALEQIEEKKYDAELLQQGIAQDRINHVGIAFKGKTALAGLPSVN